MHVFLPNPLIVTLTCLTKRCQQRKPKHERLSLKRQFGFKDGGYVNIVPV